MAASGIGVAILPDLYARQQAVHRDGVAIKPIAMGAANRDIALLARSGEEFSSAHAFLEKSLLKVARHYKLADPAQN
jgi:LysR family hydrogen peroxide-inducible transcriptional activator